MKKVQDFKAENWVWEISSGFMGYRNMVTKEWIYDSVFKSKKLEHDKYMNDYEVIAEFRSECLPFGEYPEYVIQDFLDNKHNKALQDETNIS